jgi:hypothetical protein
MRPEPLLTGFGALFSVLNFSAARAGRIAGVADLKNLIIEDRYLWRVASALKWAFADFDSASVRADMATIITDDDRKRLSELFAMRPTQFCLLMKGNSGKGTDAGRHDGRCRVCYAIGG